MRSAIVLLSSSLFMVSCITIGMAVPATTPTAAAPQLASVDNILKEATTGHLAYTAPSEAQQGDALNFKLLLSPIETAEALSNQLTSDSQSVITAEVKVTPLMKAELIAADPNAFIIQPLHDNPVQVILDNETTEWSWAVTPNKYGNQTLILSVYRLIELDGSDSWRLVQTYQSNVKVHVTAAQWLESVDWKWMVGIILAILSLPIAQNLFQRRKASRNKK